MAQTYDLIVVGTGPASAFFLLGYLEWAGPRARVLVIEKGPTVKHTDRLVSPKKLLRDSKQRFRPTDDKQWEFGIGLGGTSHLWWACTPRLLPEDFRMRSKYGVGENWPLGYDDLEPFYCQAEEVMGVAGDSEDTPFRRSKPYPFAPHRFNEPERLLKQAYPDQFFHLPSARPTGAAGQRSSCCNSGVCGLCPVDSKFTVANAMGHLFEDRRVKVLTGASVERVETKGGMVSGVAYRKGKREKAVRAELVALGANALFNPVILLNSGLDSHWTGRGLHEQVSARVEVYLAGVDSFQGSTSITGHGYMLYDGVHRRRRAAALIETWNVPKLRIEPGRWRQLLRMQVLFEDLPQEHNLVRPAPDGKPETVFTGHSEYTQRALDRLPKDLERILAPLPVERIRLPDEIRSTEGHILGTTRMSRRAKDGVVDRNLMHHQARNLIVLGGSAFPTSSPSNPTLTIAALSLWAASRARGRAAPVNLDRRGLK